MIMRMGKSAIVARGHTFHSPCIDAWLQINSICIVSQCDRLSDGETKNKAKRTTEAVINKVMREEG